jgi:GntR family transcriptional regulator of arabinose operon
MRRIEKPLHEQVFAAMLDDLQSGKLRTGDKLPSEAALTKRFSASRITIGRALRELKQRGLIEGVAGSGNFVTLQRDTGKTLLFGLLIPNLGETEIFEPICQGMAAAYERGNFALIWGQASPDSDLEKQAMQLCEQYVAQQVAGVFFAPLEMTTNSSAVNQQISAAFNKASIPVVLLDRCFLPFPKRSGHDLVGIDNRRAGDMATEHLLQTGSRDIAFLAHLSGAPTVDARIAGYREALLRHGVPVQESRVLRMPDVTPDAVLQAMQDSGIQAVVCANDRVAGQLLHALQECGIRVPHDVRVVGIDDVEYASLLPVPLTTVHQPCREIGQAAVTAMFSRRERPGMLARDILLDCRLVVRESSSYRLRPRNTD